MLVWSVIDGIGEGVDQTCFYILQLITRY